MRRIVKYKIDYLVIKQKKRNNSLNDLINREIYNYNSTCVLYMKSYTIGNLT